MDVDDDNLINYGFEINEMEVHCAYAKFHSCIKLLSTTTIPHLLSLIDGWKISLWPQMDPFLKKGLFFRNAFLRCPTQSVSLVQVDWCIGLAGGSQFAIIYFETRLSRRSVLFHRMFSKFLHVVVLPHDWPDNALLVLSQECFWFKPMLSLMI